MRSQASAVNGQTTSGSANGRPVTTDVFVRGEERIEPLLRYTVGRTVAIAKRY
jgi:hypothetical protein